MNEIDCAVKKINVVDNSQKENILNGVQAQIGAFDNKASILLSIVGIIFALALTILDVFKLDELASKSECFKEWYIIVFISFVIVTITTLFFFVMVLIPRKNPTSVKYPNYYRDIVDMNEEQLRSKIEELKYSDQYIIGQIKINANICKKKHKFLVCGITMLIPFVILITALTIMTVFI